jgi:hypothetical protein
MVSVPLPTQRRSKESQISLFVNGRTIALVVRTRPLYAKPVYKGFTVTLDELPDRTLLAAPGAADITGGWWIELLDGSGGVVIGATRVCKSSDLWKAHAAYLRDLYGAHLLLSVSATPTDTKPLGGVQGRSGQCEINLTAEALA